MSLHAHLSPEARARLERQQSSARITSIIISILTVTLVGFLLWFLIIDLPPRKFEGAKVYSTIREEEPVDPPTLQPSMRKPNPAPGGASQAVISVPAPSDLSIPQPDVDPTESEPFGSGDGIGFGEGDFLGGPSGGDGPIPMSPPAQRCSKEDRLKRLQETGGPPEIEEAVVRALRWLKEQQDQDGSWGDSHKVGMTGLALLAYLGHCQTPVSEEFGESCTDGIVFLLNRSTANKGMLFTNSKDKHWPYEHAIAVYALAEALSFSNMFGYNIPGHREAVLEGGQWIIDNQHQSGGWDYSYDEAGPRGGDLSITGWHLQALKACKAAGVELRNLTTCVRRALDYTEQLQASSGGFGYTNTSPAGGLGVHSLTGVGVLGFQIWGKDSHAAARKGVRYIRDEVTLDYNGRQSDLYAHYYHSQAMMQAGGAAWASYNKDFAEQLLGSQKPDGSFGRPGGGGEVEAVAGLFAQESPEGILYRTCLCTLMLEVYYRYLPGTGK